MNLTDSDFVWLVTEQALTAHNVPLGRYHSDLKFSNPWPEAIQLFSCATQLSMKFKLPINIKIATIIDILKFKSSK